MMYSGWGYGISPQLSQPPFTIKTVISKIDTILNRLRMSTKYCKHCDRELSVTEFHKDKKTKDGYAFYCKDCTAEYGEIYRRTASGIYSNLKGRTNYASKHHKKSGRGYSYGKTELNISREEFIEWYSKQLKQCIYCDLPETELGLYGDMFNKSIIRLTVDCKDNDKGYVLNNIGLACLRCNSIKGDIFTFDEMREIAQKYIKPKWIRGEKSQ